MRDHRHLLQQTCRAVPTVWPPGLPNAAATQRHSNDRFPNINAFYKWLCVYVCVCACVCVLRCSLSGWVIWVRAHRPWRRTLVQTYISICSQRACSSAPQRLWLSRSTKRTLIIRMKTFTLRHALCERFLLECTIMIACQRTQNALEHINTK